MSQKYAPGLQENKSLFAPRHGPAEKGKGYNLNMKPFWICPSNTLPHNLYYASSLALVDSSFINANAVAAAAIAVSSFYWPQGPKALLGAWGALWLLWLADVPRGTRKLLSSPEISAYLDKEGK
jgi:hypothetical protein